MGVKLFEIFRLESTSRWDQGTGADPTQPLNLNPYNHGPDPNRGSKSAGNGRETRQRRSLSFLLLFRDLRTAIYTSEPLRVRKLLYE